MDRLQQMQLWDKFTSFRTNPVKTLADRLGSIEVDEKAIEEGNNADIKRAHWLRGIGVDVDSKL